MQTGTLQSKRTPQNFVNSINRDPRTIETSWNRKSFRVYFVQALFPIFQIEKLVVAKDHGCSHVVHWNETSKLHKLEKKTCEYPLRCK